MGSLDSHEAAGLEHYRPKLGTPAICPVMLLFGFDLRGGINLSLSS